MRIEHSILRVFLPDELATRIKESFLLKSVLLSEMDAVIETPRLSLRHFAGADLDALAELMADADFMQFSSGVFTREQTATFLFDRVIAPARAGLPSQFALILREENRLIGYCGFFRQVVDELKEIEIGYRLHPDYWNRGLATEAARAVRDYAFEVFKLERVISLVHPENHASRRVAEKNGMKLEKTTVFRDFPVQVFSCARAAS
jgi:RimJ/RimL family protein N-acetyltransferase